MNKTPRGNRLHIAIFGRRNTGKSSLINALTNQNIALVSHVPGTTTDPVYKTMEILPIGPVVIIDTAGIDDTGDLGAMRVKRSKAVLDQTDMVLLVQEAGEPVSPYETEIIKASRQKKIPVVAALNKSDLNMPDEDTVNSLQKELGVEAVPVSAMTGYGLADLKIAIIRHAPEKWDSLPLVGDLIEPGDTAVLVVPIDSAAPKGRLILPQVQTLRDILDHDAIAVVAKENNLKDTLARLGQKPKIVITDSQAFKQVAADTPKDVLLTSFSILFARQKGELETLAEGVKAIDALRPGDKILIAEACTHHRVEDDIGRVKLPRWLNQAAGGELRYDWASGTGFPENLREYKLVMHCGACMINRREMLARMARVKEYGVPVVNYGIAIAHLMGILPRALSPFPQILRQLTGYEEDHYGDKSCSAS